MGRRRERERNKVMGGRSEKWEQMENIRPTRHKDTHVCISIHRPSMAEGLFFPLHEWLAC